MKIMRERRVLSCPMCDGDRAVIHWCFYLTHCTFDDVIHEDTNMYSVHSVLTFRSLESHTSLPMNAVSTNACSFFLIPHSVSNMKQPVLPKLLQQ